MAIPHYWPYHCQIGTNWHFFLPICTKPIMQLDSNPEPLSSLNIYIYIYVYTTGSEQYSPLL